MNNTTLIIKTDWVLKNLSISNNSGQYPLIYVNECYEKCYTTLVTLYDKPIELFIGIELVFDMVLILFIKKDNPKYFIFIFCKILFDFILILSMF